MITPSICFGITQRRSVKPVSRYSSRTYRPQRVATMPTSAQKFFIKANPKSTIPKKYINTSKPVKTKSPTLIRKITREDIKPIKTAYRKSSLNLSSHKKPSAPRIGAVKTEANNTGRGVAVSKVNEKFTDHMNTKLFKFIKKSMTLSMKNPIAQITWAEMIGESVEQLFNKILGVHKPGKATPNDSINNFKMQLQYLAEQIYSYNDISTYTKPEEMLLLIKFINQFLEENQTISVSDIMLEKLNMISSFAAFSCDQFKNKDMIFSTTSAPREVVSYFKQPIMNINNLSKIKYSRPLMYTIYDTDGYMDQIIQTWQDFKTSELSSDVVNRQYASFLAFLLLFQNSMVAAAIVLDDTSDLYEVTNPVPVIINIV